MRISDIVDLPSDPGDKGHPSAIGRALQPNRHASESVSLDPAASKEDVTAESKVAAGARALRFACAH
jgi:hypothetical protein